MASSESIKNIYKRIQKLKFFLFFFLFKNSVFLKNCHFFKNKKKREFYFSILFRLLVIAYLYEKKYKK